jgi:hypothetical protein
VPSFGIDNARGFQQLFSVVASTKCQQHASPSYTLICFAHFELVNLRRRPYESDSERHHDNARTQGEVLRLRAGGGTRDSYSDMGRLWSLFFMKAKRRIV